MKRIELLKTLALALFIALGAAITHAGDDAAKVAETADQTCVAATPCHKAIFVSHPQAQDRFALPRADMG